MSSIVRPLVVIGYFGGLGYAFAKSGLDKRLAKAVKQGYTELVRYTKTIDQPKVTLVQIVAAEPEHVSRETPGRSPEHNGKTTDEQKQNGYPFH